MAIFPIFKIFPYDTLFLLLPFNLCLIQGIAGELLRRMLAQSRNVT